MIVRMVAKAGALAVVVALMAGCASDHSTDADLVSSLPPTASDAAPAQSGSLPPGLLGSWSGAATLTLDDCIVGEECGRLERVDDNQEHCWYTLTSLGKEANGYGFKTSGGNSFGCAWSPWANGTLVVEQSADDSILVFIEGSPTVTAFTTATLTRG